jgi:trigger factor
MEIKVSEIEACKLNVHCEANALEILNKRGEVMSAFKKAPVKGFREGRASPEAIKFQYKDQIEDALKRALAEDSYHEALFQHKLRPHGAPRFTSVLMADGKFACDFEVYTKPDFELAPYQNLEVPKPHMSMNEAELAARMLQELRVKYGEISPYTDQDFVQRGDNILADYEGTIDGVKIDTLCATGEMLAVGSSQLVAFDDNLLGMALGETREFDLTVPKEGLPSLAGKTVHFKITINMGTKTIPCALDDELAKKLAKKDYEELRGFIHTVAAAKIANAFKELVNNAVAQKLIADNTIAIPNWMSLSEAQYLVHNAQLEWATLADVDKESYLALAEKNVKLSLILDKVRENNPDAQLSDQEVFEVIKSNLAQTKVDKPIDEIIANMNKSGYLQILFSRIKDEYALDMIVKATKIVE